MIHSSEAFLLTVVVEEFERAKEEVSKDPASIPIWQPIIAKYNPTFIGECEKAIAWSNEMTKEWLKTGMFLKHDAPKEKIDEIIDKIIEELGDHALTKSHARHLSAARCREMGLKVTELEKCQNLQDAVLSLHHACMLTFSQTQAIKMIENHKGVAFIKIAQQVMIAGQPMSNKEKGPIETPEDNK